MSMKLIGAFILMCALVGAGGYYYFFVVEPQRYVAAVLELKRAFDEDAKVLTKSDISGQFDYRGTFDVVLARRAFLEGVEKSIDALSPPLWHEEIHEFQRQWREVFAGYREANADAEERVNLLLGFSDLSFLLEKDPKPPFDEKTAYMRDLQAVFEKTFGSLRQAMDEAVRVAEPRVNGETEFQKLKSLWPETRLALEITLNFMRAQNPNAKLSGYSPKGPTRREQEASDIVMKFGEALKEFLGQNTAYDILAYRYFDGFGENVAKPAEEAEAMFAVLKMQYAK